MKNAKWIYLLVSIALFLIPLIQLVMAKSIYLDLADFAAYSAVSRTIFEGNNPFPDHFDLLFCQYRWGNIVPIVYPGQMLFFVLPGYLWGKAIQIAWLVLNVAAVFFLTALTLVNSWQGYHWRDLWLPGRKQFFYALCCFCFLSSSCVKESLSVGQIPIILTLCLYCMFWGPFSRCLRRFLFAFIALAKYSLLPVFAPLLFLKGYWKLCIAAFSIFVFFSITPFFFGNSLLKLYPDYLKAVALTFQPGGINHYDLHPDMCHLGFFKLPLINHSLKTIVFGIICWLFWRERNNHLFSDTLLLLAFSLTLLVSYHKYYDVCLLFPLFFIRLHDFAKNKQWLLLGITAIFPFFLIIPRTLSILMIPSWFGSIPGLSSVIYLYDNPWSTHYTNVIPILPFFTIALALWSLYLYLHVKAPYRLEILEPLDKKSPEAPQNNNISKEAKS